MYSQTNGEKKGGAYNVGEKEQWCIITLGYVKAFSRQYAAEVLFDSLLAFEYYLSYLKGNAMKTTFCISKLAHVPPELDCYKFANNQILCEGFAQFCCRLLNYCLIPF